MDGFDEAVHKVLGMLKGNSAAEEVLQGLETGDLAPADAYTKLRSILERDGHKDELGGMRGDFPVKIPIQEPIPLTMETDEGIPMLNPLVEAAIAELASIDGDVPQLRTGPLPKGATPAVPIETSVADPVMVGMMLQQAATRIQEAIQIAVKEHKKISQEMLTGGALEASRPMPPVPTGVEGYEAGRAAVPMRVEKPTQAAVAALTPSERRSAARRALATTQGRTSLCPVVGQLIIGKLAVLGIDARPGSVREGAFTARWAVHTWADDEIQAAFSPLESASAAIASKIHAAIDTKRVTIEIVPVNGTAERNFGWAAKVQPEEEP
jgi:hypothetical protein